MKIEENWQLVSRELLGIFVVIAAEIGAKLSVLQRAWLICSVAADWLIAGSLTWTLSKLRTNIDDTQGFALNSPPNTRED